MKTFITPHGWQIFRFKGSKNHIQYHIFTSFNDSVFWSKRINLETDISKVADDFIWTGDFNLPVKLEKLREGNIRNLQKISLEHDIAKYRQQWCQVDKVKMADVIADT